MPRYKCLEAEGKISEALTDTEELLRAFPSMAPVPVPVPTVFPLLLSHWCGTPNECIAL